MGSTDRLLCITLLRWTDLSYPGDSCVENQTATGLQNQHGIYILRTKVLLSQACLVTRAATNNDFNS